MDTALIVINAQLNKFEPEPVYRADVILEILTDLIKRARVAGAPVVFIRNNGVPGKPDEPGSSGWKIHPQLAPLVTESIIDKHTHDSFYQTELAGVLAERGTLRLVITGMETEYSIDTTCRQAYSMDYSVTLVSDAHSTYHTTLGAEQIIEHHNRLLQAFAQVRPAAEITFDSPDLPTYELEAITLADRAGIQNGLDEWPVYDNWMATGTGWPFWPYSHPARLADRFKSLWDPEYSPRSRYVDPPRWEVGMARAFMRPLENIPPAFRKTNLQAVKGAIDHLLQNPRNPLSMQIRPLDEQLWLYESRDLRLFYVPQVTLDKDGRKRHYVFLVWLAPGVPVHNPFA